MIRESLFPPISCSFGQSVTQRQWCKLRYLWYQDSPAKQCTSQPAVIPAWLFREKSNCCLTAFELSNTYTCSPFRINLFAASVTLRLLLGKRLAEPIGIDFSKSLLLGSLVRFWRLVLDLDLTFCSVTVHSTETKCLKRGKNTFYHRTKSKATLPIPVTLVDSLVLSVSAKGKRKDRSLLFAPVAYLASNTKISLLLERINKWVVRMGCNWIQL